MTAREVPFVIQRDGDSMVAILHEGVAGARRGVVMVVGGPQYRVGGHRHYVALARDLAGAGVPVLRYDYRGIGDSTGRLRGFEDLNDDIRAGIDAMQQRVGGLAEVVLWGLCESASAVALYAEGDARVSGIVMVNPYASTVGGRARAVLRHYYLKRLFSGALWRQVFGGRLNVFRSLGRFAADVVAAGRGGAGPAEVAIDGAAAEPYRDLQIRPADRQDPVALPDRMARALERYKGRVLLVISGDDLTAQEFLAAARSRRWAAILARPTTARFDLAEADHTFSRAEWLGQVSAAARRWLASW